jgi:hypothetical protein
LPRHLALLDAATFLEDRRYAFLVRWQMGDGLPGIARWYHDQLLAAPPALVDRFGDSIDEKIVHREIRRAAAEVDLKALRRDEHGRGRRRAG